MQGELNAISVELKSQVVGVSPLDQTVDMVEEGTEDTEAVVTEVEEVITMEHQEPEVAVTDKGTLMEIKVHQVATMLAMTTEIKHLLQVVLLDMGVVVKLKPMPQQLEMCMEVRQLRRGLNTVANLMGTVGEEEEIMVGIIEAVEGEIMVATDGPVEGETMVEITGPTEVVIMGGTRAVGTMVETIGAAEGAIMVGTTEEAEEVIMVIIEEAEELNMVVVTLKGTPEVEDKGVMVLTKGLASLTTEGTMEATT